MKTKDFHPDYLWIAERLGLSKARVEDCMKRLLFLGLIKETRNGLVRSFESIHTVTDIQSKHLRQAHHNELGKALDVMENTSVRVRDFRSSTMSVNPDKIASARKMITDFQSRLIRHLEQGEKTEVYNFNMQLYPLTKLEDPK